MWGKNKDPVVLRATHERHHHLKTEEQKMTVDGLPELNPTKKAGKFRRRRG